jgi:Holliday junction resolvase RusA-like endonuclease
VTLTLPWPPSTNRSHEHVRGRVILRESTRRYREDATAAIYDQLGIPPQIARPVRIVATFHPPKGYRGDLDNLIKQTLDALECGGVLANDKHVVAISASKGVAGAACVQLTIMDAEGPTYGTW